MHFSTDSLARYLGYGLADPANAVDYGFNSFLERISDFAYHWTSSFLVLADRRI